MDAKRAKDFLAQYAIYFVLLALIVAIAVYNTNFLSISTFRDVLLQSATRIIIALGMGFILITGGVDLSAGRVVGLAAVLSASMLQSPDYSRLFFPGLSPLPLILPIIVAIVASLMVGCINGLVVSRLSVPPFIATLGTYVAVYGANSLYFDMKPNESQPIGGLRTDFTSLGSGSIGTGDYSLPYIVLIAIVVACIVWVIYNKTKLGKNMYAIGGNVNAAIVSGINVKWNLLVIYAIAAGLFGFAGVLEAARTGGATNNYGNMYELDAIAACVIGGVSTAGGIGTVPGILVGVLILTVINYGLTFVGISPYWQLIIKGSIIVSAVAVDIRKYISKR
ncbi:galactose/methyl galactoside ABC transporter permease MglC [Propionispora hippei]|uniref:Methyl-galactoside transport system permease protein n=1 Tax=Propionispora hippei DSM 15287 TaxID=1123003 RepID=A0A1M6NDA9_9FIRM|nr:galactose/methyl galactoside ABC transporter permease MglC [Propionispora hippei]SHJ93599.1 methyl-galactoside transport system permease protein [Propionispora hippei DSM 15287]